MSSILFYASIVILGILTIYFHEGGHKLACIVFNLKPNKIIWKYYFLPIGVEANWPNKWFMLTGIAGAMIGNLIIVKILKYLNIIPDSDYFRLIGFIIFISIGSGIKIKWLGSDIYYFLHFEDLEKYDYNRENKM